MVTEIRNRGQITLPTELLKKLKLATGDHIDLEIEDGNIIIKPVMVIPKDQAWYWTPEWQAAERRADEDIKAGRVTPPMTGDEAVDFLRNRAKPV